MSNKQKKVKVNLERYLAPIILGLGIVSVYVMIYAKKQADLKAAGTVQNSFIQYHLDKGKPVETYKIVDRDIKTYVMLTAVPKSSRKLESYADPSVIDHIRKGAEVLDFKSSELSGKVSYVSRSPDIDNGLYKVVVTTNKKISNTNRLRQIKITRNSTGGKVIVPGESLVLSDGKFHVYKVEDGKVKLVFLKPGMYNRQFVEAKGALKVGDVVVLKGASLLREGDKVSIEKSTDFSK